jgi:hypothetical protein
MAGRVSYYGNIVKDGLVLDLDAAKLQSYPRTGTLWNDISGLQNNGTLINGPTFNSDKGGSIVFDGVNDYTQFGDILDLGTNNCTINVWLKINSSWASGTRYFVSKALQAAQNYRYGFGFTQTRQLLGFLQGNGGPDIGPRTIITLNLNEWYMCTMVINRDSIIQLFINGIIQSTTSDNTISQWSGLNFQSINPFRVGSFTAVDNVSVAIPFPGNISQTLMYFRALSASEVLQNYNATKNRYL